MVPLAAWYYVRTRVRRHLWLIVGAALGLVISPLSLGLYSIYFVSPFGFPTGMLGLASTLFHGAPGYHVALWLDLVPSHEVVSGRGSIYVELLNGVIRAVVYGSLGFIADWARLAHSRTAA